MSIKKQKFMVILECELCGKQGAAAFSPAHSINSQLQNKTHEKFIDCGFYYKPVGGGVWCIHCEQCKKDNKEMKELHEVEKDSFEKGQSWDVIKYQRGGGMLKR